MQSDTPETNNAEKHAYEFSDDMTPVVESHIARQLEMERNALIAITKAALTSFRCTQKPEDYPADHWSRRAIILLENVDVEASVPTAHSDTPKPQ